MSIPLRPEGLSDEEWADYVYEHRNDPVDPADIETIEVVPSQELATYAAARRTRPDQPATGA